MLGHMIWRSHVTRAMSVLWVISGTSYCNSTENNKNDNNNGNDKNNNNNSNNNNWNYYYHYRCCFVVVVVVIVAAVEFGSLILLVTLDCSSKCILHIYIYIYIYAFWYWFLDLILEISAWNLCLKYGELNSLDFVLEIHFANQPRLSFLKVMSAKNFSKLISEKRLGHSIFTYIFRKLFCDLASDSQASQAMPWQHVLKLNLLNGTFQMLPQLMPAPDT